MSTSQNLCLICCYTFQEKRSRFISDEARESFRKFCGELQLGLPFGNRDSDRRDSKKTKNAKPSSGLDLPYGENITVCGDCLSLVVLYVQRKTVQSGKEEKLLELQKAVCAALKDLREVVEEVQGHIDELHNTVRTGDESCLDSFCRMKSTEADKENNPRAFRARILKLNTGLMKEKNSEKDRQPNQIPVNIKLEPRDEESRMSMPMDDDDDGNFDDSFFAPQDDDQTSEHEEHHLEIPSARAGTDGNAKTRRGRPGRRRTVEKTQFREDFPPSSPDNDADDALEVDNFVASERDDDDDAESDYFDRKVKVEPGKKRRRGRPRKNAKVKYVKKSKTERPNVGSNIHEVEKASQQAASQWKDDLIGRIVMQLNDDIHDGTTDPSQQQTGTDAENYVNDVINGGNSDNAASGNNLVSNSFQIIDGKLKLRDVIVNIREKQRALQCTKCRKKYFEKGDVSGDDVQLERLMRDHILSRHVGSGRPMSKPKFPTIEVLSYTSSTKSKITYKLACSRKYSYTRRVTIAKSGVSYFRCDNRQENCRATILYRDGQYYKMTNGWNPDGSHSIHAPDVERTNKQIEVGRAKEMFISNSTKSIDDICDDILNQSNGQLMTPLRRLKERMLYAKYQTTTMPEVEKARRSFPCPHCDTVYKEKRNLSQHIRDHHDPSGAPRPYKKPSSPRKSATLVKKAKKVKSESKQNVSDDPETPASEDGPSIVFNDPSVASNFVNKCISAIMQQVGLSVTGGNSSQVRPIASELQRGSGDRPSSSTSPAPSDMSQQESNPVPQHQIHAPHHSRSGSQQNSGQWQQPSVAQSEGHPGYPPNPNSAGWPWTLH